MLNKRKSTQTINRDLETISRHTTIAYVLATVVLCCTIAFSFFTLKGILDEQANLNSLGQTTTKLRVTIRDSSLYLSDLKLASQDQFPESQLKPKVTSLLYDSMMQIRTLKSDTSKQLARLEGYNYYDQFHDLFYAPPSDIWRKLDQYLLHLKKITSDEYLNTPGMQQLWLPVETTAARTGSLGKSYAKGLAQLQIIISKRSENLRKTHTQLTLLSLVIVLLELFFIFLPLQGRLKAINNKLYNAHKKLHRQAHYDEQTGLPNVTGMSQQINESKEALIITSVVNHEDIAQLIGPAAMDEFFSKHVNRIRSYFDDDTILYKAGDNRVGLLFSGTDTLSALSDLTRYKRALCEKMQIANTVVYPEIQIGGACGAITADNLPDKTVDALTASHSYNHLDTSVSFFDASMRSKVEDENTIIEKIRDGIANNEFFPYYQLKVNASTQKISGMEALCRWVKPDGTLIHPGDFIPIAEKSGLIAEITWQLLEKMSQDYRGWVDAGTNPGRIAFNAAEMLLVEPNFPAMLDNILEKTGAAECPFDLEITENVALSNQGETINRNLSHAKKRGLLIALDDFGTGFASLSSIINLDFDTIKIDRSFVCVMEASEDARNIVSSIIKLCQELKKKSVVEGVETEYEWNFCREQGCDEIQGYYFYKPAPYSDALDSLLKEQASSKAA